MLKLAEAPLISVLGALITMIIGIIVYLPKKDDKIMNLFFQVTLGFIALALFLSIICILLD